MLQIVVFINLFKTKATMKKHYSKYNFYKIPWPLLAIVLIMVSIDINAQGANVSVPFTQRAAAATPTQLIYKIKGDFTMIGNSNMTLATYGNTTNNNNNAMIYNDIDGDATTLNSSSAALTFSSENGAIPSCSNIIYAGLYWTGRSIANQYTFTTTKNGVTKNYDKRQVSIKGPNASSYTTITSNNIDIKYPTSNANTTAAVNGIYVGYSEITDYVKTNGIGNYTVADIALVEGNPDGVGYCGGWGLIVIYENNLMKSRDITVFDGYAQVVSNGGASDINGDIPISGFRTVPTGPVNMKLGVMATEGDVGVSGDYLKIQKLNSTNAADYVSLSHPGNTTTNFFNSSIYTGGNTRNPNILNNTGMDLSMFEIPNAGNSVIANNQTSTTFRYGTLGELYTIFGLAMSVDTYIPEPEGIMALNSINSISNPPQPYSVLPGQEIEYKLIIRNKGSEAINNTIITVPISNTINFIVGSIVSTKDALVTTTNLPYYDAATQSIIWDMGILPLAADPTTILATITFKVRATEDCAIIINNSCNSVISVSGTINGIGDISGVTTSKAIFKGYDNSNGCQTPISSPTTVALDNSGSPCFYNIAGPDQVLSCGGEIVTLSATSGTTGTWTIVSGPAGGGEIFSNSASTSSTFYSPNAGSYLLRWTTGCALTTDDVIITFVNCNILNFDGIDDNVTFKNNYSLSTGSFSVEVWIKPHTTSANIQTIFSKRVGTSTADGYDLKLVNNSISFNWNNGNSITSAYPINTDRWYHIAVTFDGSSYKLYIDGIVVQNAVSGTNPTANNNANCLLGAMDQSSGIPFNYFNGWMDELRIWKIELAVDQIRQMMNQEILNNAGNVKGAIVPLDISGLSWSNLDGYYPMNPTNDIVNGFVLGKSTTAINGKLRNIGTQQPDTAPLPYTSRISNQDWTQDDTWTYYSVWDVPNSLAVDGVTKIDWNIVKTTHNIISTGNKTVLGLLVNSHMISAENNSKIEVSHYLKLDGKIDLVGKSQLVQTEGSILDTSSSGSLERDQQGQSNLYNYNYWCSPVSPINNIQNNLDYSINGVLRDGTNPANPQNINWVGGYDGAPTTPVSLARYWLYKFDNYTNLYANWVKVLETDPIRVGQGFTMKGSGTTSSTQNYTFIGKPNNGTIISNTVTPDNLLLTGNPYPSALNATAFINDNIDSIDGNLYFWEHYTTNNTHILRDYQGGYAVRNLTGGIPPTSEGVELISGLGTSYRGIPGQYIPVGLGFFVNGKIGAGGTVTFKNSQRGFVKEDDVASNIMYKKRPGTKSSVTANNSNDYVAVDSEMKIRLGFNSNNGYHRQVLLGFMNEKATERIDFGYDAINYDNFPNDMYFVTDDNQLVIQGVGSFDTTASYPIGVKTNIEGKVSFTLDALENFDSSQSIYIYDNITNTFNVINNSAFEVDLPIGIHDTRFSLRFTNKEINPENTLSSNEQTYLNNGFLIFYSKNDQTLVIKNSLLESEIETVNLYDTNGKSILDWTMENQEQSNIQIPIKNLSSGVYIVKLKTTSGEIIKKIVLK